MILKVEHLGFNLADHEVSAIAARLNDYLESYDKVLLIIKNIIGRLKIMKKSRMD